jgi:hypothetical protein
LPGFHQPARAIEDNGLANMPSGVDDLRTSERSCASPYPSSNNNDVHRRSATAAVRTHLYLLDLGLSVPQPSDITRFGRVPFDVGAERAFRALAGRANKYVEDITIEQAARPEDGTYFDVQSRVDEPLRLAASRWQVQSHPVLGTRLTWTPPSFPMGTLDFDPYSRTVGERDGEVRFLVSMDLCRVLWLRMQMPHRSALPRDLVLEKVLGGILPPKRQVAYIDRMVTEGNAVFERLNATTRLSSGNSSHFVIFNEMDERRKLSYDTRGIEGTRSRPSAEGISPRSYAARCAVARAAGVEELETLPVDVERVLSSLIERSKDPAPGPTTYEQSVAAHVNAQEWVERNVPNLSVRHVRRGSDVRVDLSTWGRREPVEPWYPSAAARMSVERERVADDEQARLIEGLLHVAQKISLVRPSVETLRNWHDARASEFGGGVHPQIVGTLSALMHRVCDVPMDASEEETVARLAAYAQDCKQSLEQAGACVRGQRPDSLEQLVEIGKLAGEHIASDPDRFGRTRQLNEALVGALAENVLCEGRRIAHEIGLHLHDPSLDFSNRLFPQLGISGLHLGDPLQAGESFLRAIGRAGDDARSNHAFLLPEAPGLSVGSLDR